MAKPFSECIERCDGMRKDGTCGNGYNVENHNKPCAGIKCPHRFTYGKTAGEVAVVAEPVTVQVVDVDQDYKERVREQYLLVEKNKFEFLKAVRSFGGLLCEVELYIGKGRGRGNEGRGLRGWLADNCPDINYNTAQAYKSMAAKVAKMIGGGVQAIACLQGRDTVIDPVSQKRVAIDPTFIAKRDELDEKVESRRQLEQLWFEFCGEREKKRPGRPVGSKAQTPKVDTNNPTVAARAEWSRVIAVAAQNDATLRAAARLLERDDVENGLTILRTLTDYLREREAELRQG